MIYRVIGLIAIAGLTLAPAFVQGHFSHRWGNPVDLSIAAENLQDLPVEIKGFQYLGEGETLSQYVIDELGLAGQITRTYRDPKTGQSFALLVMVGEAGKMVRHPPNFCYAARDNKEVGEMNHVKNVGPGKASDYKVLSYRRGSLDESEFKVAFTHSTDGTWTAPTYPRWTFGGKPYLYKLQVLVTGESSSKSSEAALERFLESFFVTFPQALSDAQPAT